jgi:hypothetical protein
MIMDGDDLFVGAGENGLDIYDIADPNDIQRLRTVFTGGNATALVLNEGYVYLADGSPGVSVVDVRNPAEAEKVGSYQTLGRAALGVAIRDNYLFVADGTNGVVVLDITIPEEPVFFARYRPGDRPTFISVTVDEESDMVYAGAEETGIYSLRFDPGADEFTIAPVSGDSLYELESPRSMVLQEDRLLVAAGDEGLQILQIAGDGSLSMIGQAATNGFSIHVAANDGYAFVADGFNGLVSVDISNPAFPDVASVIDFSADVTGVALRGDSLYMGNNDRGIAVVDIADPTSLSLAVRPVLRFCQEIEPVGGGEFDTLRSPAEEETLLAYSDVMFCWEGISAGGRVIGYRYQLQGVNVDPIQVGPDSINVTYRDLPPRDLYEFTVDTKDETGLWSTGDQSGSRKFTVNFDPETTLDSLYYRSRILGVDFVSLMDSVRMGITPRLPDSSKIYFEWSTTDRDTEIPNVALRDSVIGNFWNVNGAGIFSQPGIETQITHLDSAYWLTASPVGTPYKLEVGGIDKFGRRERNGATFEFAVNFAPTVGVNVPQPNETLFQSGNTITIEMTVQDPDGPPHLVLLRYELEKVEDGLRQSIIRPTETTPQTAGFNGQAVEFDLELEVEGTRGFVEFTVTPIDRTGAGSSGETTVVPFFISS